jgi:flagellar hook-associated protein 2
MTATALPSVNLTPTITSLGVGSGLNLNSIVTSLVAVEQQPITQLLAQATVLQTQISDFGQISSLTSTLQDAASALRNPGLWNAQAITSSNSTAVSATATSGALSGNYAVSVQNLASAQTVVSGTSYSSASSLVGSGNLTLQLGTWSGSTFQGQSGNPTTIAVSSTDTLQSLVSKINSAGMGVTASLVTDASGVRLALSSINTGAANGFQVTGDDPSLAGVAYDPSNSSAAGTGSMTLAAAGTNANAIINGISVSSASNTITGAVYGLSLTLGQTTTTPVNVAVTPDQTSISNAIQSFVTAFNGLASYLQTTTAYDASTQVAGDLQGNSSANSVQQLLRNTLNMTTSSSTAFTSLSDVGIQFQRDGTLSIDQPTLNAALTNLPQLKSAFATINSNGTANGFASNFVNMSLQLIGPSGLVTNTTSSLKTQLSQNQSDQTALNNQVAAYQQTLVAQYSALDAQLGQLSSLSSYVNQQLAGISGSSSSSSSSS